MSKKKGLKCIIAGSRNVFNMKILKLAIEASGWADEITEVVCGDAYGVDKLGEQWANDNSIPIKHFPADWSNITAPDAVVRENSKGKYNAKAGYIRNQNMCDYADCLIAVIKDNSRGTADMIERIQKANKPCSIWEV